MVWSIVARIGRTQPSIEFKHQNISAVLDALGLPWIEGYKPRHNYQQAIFGAIDRYLSAHPAVLDAIPAPTTIPINTDVFVSAPIPDLDDIRPASLERLVRKFDPVDRDHRNRALGKAGEAFVVAIEQHRLIVSGRPDLAAQVRWVAQLDWDGAGYDIRSFSSIGTETLIEVKTTNGGSRTPFFLTRTEREVAEERPEAWRLYRVHRFSQVPQIWTLVPPLDAVLQLRAETWRASF